MARKHGFRFGLPTVFAARPPVGGVGLGCQPIRFAAAARFGAPGSVWPDSDLSDSKSPRRIFRQRTGEAHACGADVSVGTIVIQRDPGGFLLF